MKWKWAGVLCLFSSSLMVGQSAVKKMPCDYHGRLLRGPNGQLTWFNTEQMKERATQKHDLDGLIRQLDARGVVIVDLLINPDGTVACAKGISGMPLLRSGTERALKQWRFKAAAQSGKPLAYLGRMEFVLCNIDCAEGEMGMTLLK